MALSCFKAYDIRGKVPGDLDEDLAYKVGRAYAAFLDCKTVVVGHDIRLSGPGMTDAVARGLQDAGVHVLDLGECGTEQIYFATFHEKLDGGIMITASHNPADYNGLKLVREQAKPISSDTGLKEIERRIEQDDLGPVAAGGKRTPLNVDAAYIEHLLGYVNLEKLKPLKVVVNAGNGGAGRVIDLLEPHLPFRFIKVQHEPDGRFPNGVPNPLLPDNREATAAAIRAQGADIGIAWDGDFDRCFFFDENARFIEGYYLVGLLASQVLSRQPGAKVVYDPRLTWNTLEIVQNAGGTALQCKSGHAFIKQFMREHDAAYGGEMSAHHYFREFSYCDSGMVPWLLVLDQMCASGQSLGQLVGERMKAFPASGEINRKLDDPAAALKSITEHYSAGALSVDETDGVSIAFDRWRFNLRMSNTEPLIRLNVETRGDESLMREKTNELLAFLER